MQVSRAELVNSITIPADSGIHGGSVTLSNLHNKKSKMYYRTDGLHIEWSTGHAVVPLSNIKSVVVIIEDDHVKTA